MREPFYFNSFYYIEMRTFANSVIKMACLPHGGISNFFFVVNAISINETLSRKFCPDSNLRVKAIYESVK